ncbi:MAG TPA: FkbM family methyltransferase [Azospirillaceae bacterium]|nr:FkbM family methyltransferase [Azospirillaceae bacterium]
MQGNRVLPKADRHLAQAMDHHRAGRLADAEEAYRKSVALSPRHAEAQHLLGVACLQQGKYEDAVAAISRAIAIDRKDDYCSNLGNALLELGRVEEAEKSYRDAIALNPRSAEAHSNRGTALQQLGRTDEAAEAYLAAMRLRPELAEAPFNLGNILAARGRLEEAAEAYHASLRVRPVFPEALTNLGNVLRRQGRSDEAIAVFRTAIQQRPSLPDTHLNLGNALVECGRFAEAEASFRRTIEVKPDLPEAHSNLGQILMLTGRLDEAAAAVRRSLDIDPGFVDGHCNLSAILLLKGDFESGWHEYEWRWRKPGLPVPLRDFGRPQWQGEDISDKVILLHHEQALGDAIQFVRYALVVRPLAREVVLEVPSMLMALFSSLPGVRLVAYGDPLPPVDVQCALMSLPRVLGTRLGNVPAPVPYLSAEPDRVASWRDALPGAPFRVGIAWQGKPGTLIDHGRSFPLAALEPLSHIPGVQLVSLQKTHGLDQLDALPWKDKVHTLGPDFDTGGGAFLDTAAVMANLDLVVTSDTSIAHLAGALGRPTWVALKQVPDWRWMLDRADSPWYPTMRLFRQQQDGDWTPVFARMAAELALAAGGDRGCLLPPWGTVAAPEPRGVSSPGSGALAASLPPAAVPPAAQTAPQVLEVEGRYGRIRFLASDTVIGRCLAAYGEWSEGEMELCRAVLRPGDVVVEAGSNIGAHTSALAKAVGPDGTVHAFEPQRVLYELMADNVGRNAPGNVILHHAAVGAAPGTLVVPAVDYAGPLNFGGVAMGRSGDGDSVPVTTVDDLGLDRLRLLKADVEGMELEILLGASGTISRCRPLIYVENDRRDRSPELIGTIQRLGYRLWWHLPFLYNPANHLGNATNLFERVISINMLCVPAEKDCVVVGLREIQSPTDHWSD